MKKGCEIVDFNVDIVPVEEVAKMFSTTPPKITAAMLNGTLPIGFVADGKQGERTRTFIIRRRLQLFVSGADLEKA